MFRFQTWLTIAAILIVPALALAQPGAATPPPRKLAPGVIKIVAPEPQPGETFTGPMELGEVTSLPGLSFTPNYTPQTDTVLARAKRVTLRRDIWSLEFSFKPLRMTYVDVPQPDGNMAKKLVWYMCYKVTNPGSHYTPAPTTDEHGHTLYVTKQADRTIRFFPHFVLQGVVPQSDGTYTRKEYLDRVIPVAKRVVDSREDIRKPLHNTVEMMKVPIEVSRENDDRSVWGIVTWENIDPRTDYFMVYIQGLTNAFQMSVNPDGSRSYTHKTLQLNFFRPGDSVNEHEKEIHYGVPVFGTPIEQEALMKQYGLDPTKERRVDFRWIYR